MKEKQIEEMAELICDNYANGKCATDGFVCNHNCEYKDRAEALYNAGYRKQSEGEWIEGKSLEKCSICGKKGFPDWKFCPNCGAKMKGGEG